GWDRDGVGYCPLKSGDRGYLAIALLRCRRQRTQHRGQDDRKYGVYTRCWKLPEADRTCRRALRGEQSPYVVFEEILDHLTRRGSASGRAPQRVGHFVRPRDQGWLGARARA